MNRRTRLFVAVASMLPLGLGVIICCLLALTGTAAADVVSALVIAVVVQGVVTYIRLRHTTPTTCRGRTSPHDNSLRGEPGPSPNAR